MRTPRFDLITAAKRFSKLSTNRKKSNSIGMIVVGVIGIIIGIPFFFIDRDFALIGILIALFSGLILIPGLIGFSVAAAEEQEQKEYEEKLLKANMATIDRMDGKTFERFLAALFKKQGYAVQLTKASGDYGVDLILNKDETKIIVQAKRYANKVSIDAVQEISAAKGYYHATNAWVVTNNFFTGPAINLANANGIRLIDRKELIEIICSTKDTVAEAEVRK